MARITPNPVCQCDRCGKPIKDPKPEGTVALTVTRGLAPESKDPGSSVVVHFDDLCAKCESTIDSVMKRVRMEKVEPKPKGEA